MRNMLFTAVATLSILSVAFLLPSSSRQEEAKLLSDVGAELRLVACCATSARTSSLRNTQLVSNIINALPEDVHVLLIVNDRAAFVKSGKDRRVTFVEMPTDSDMSIWPQDPFVVVQSETSTRLVTPCSFEREDDERIPRQLAKLLQLDLVHSELQFEGGNIVCGADEVLMGFDTIQQNVDLLEISADEVQQRFELLFGRQVLIVGDAPQSVAHIDLVVTPLSQGRVAVADSRAGAQLAAEALSQDSRQVEEFERQCEQEFFGQAGVVKLLDRDGNTIESPPVVGQTASTIDASMNLAPELDAIAKQLAAAGYQVVRIPALIPDQQLPVDEQGDVMPQYPFLSYCNILTETRQNRSIAYVPQYGFDKLDRDARRAWEALGYQVRTIKGFATSAMYGGALRCCTKVLLRD